MRLILLSLLLFFACWGASRGAQSYSYLADNVPVTHGLLSILCLVLFLLGVVVAVSANTDREGRLQPPRTLPALVSLLLLLPHGGMAIGVALNYQSSLQIMMAAKDSAGVPVYRDEGFVVLDGEIGHDTLLSLQALLPDESIPMLLLRSPGGIIGVGVELGEILEENQIDVLVPENCESACVIVALSAARLFVSPDASFGFHRGSAVASDHSQLGRYIGNISTAHYVSVLRDLGIPESVLEITENTPTDDMYYLTGEELIEFGLALDESEYWGDDL